ncbi:MAG: TIGR03089 family protein [Renibacterium salmoninarum]|nr:TIGR03089 family protein [Renibacterium salmoninarum]
MTAIDSLLHSLRTVDPGAPRLTWYGPDGERIELSGKVLDNWVAKSANFLTEEFDVAAGALIALQLPAHWKSLCICLAGLACAATVRFVAEPDSGLADSASVWFAAETSGLAAAARRTDAVAVALPALAMAWPGALPDDAEVHDFAAEVRMFADAFVRFDDPEPDGIAMAGLDRSVDYARVAGLAEGWDAASRVALDAGEGLSRVAFAALGIWQAGGSVVLFSDAALASEKLLQAEGVTRRG